ncbi:MATE family efflux transporter [Bacillus haynesii]|uniref:MATE family efflux transporter n=1 Tax=Bacillus haynesii TaxID=1925021 RepID=UPI00227F697D|nr:MATE family efflux transporter [Bacillus haynesii]MCY8679480.1 MATE family efflux transporter [Bacillus haynesii]MCY9323121.1 MATE family efflux transporter [Bacillus haynesii]
MMTETHQQLMKLPVNQVFFKYFIPATLGLILMSANILIDGLFVGNGIGTAALAGVNLSYPVISLIMAIALWIGIGGATKYSISIGENRPQMASSVFSLALASTFIISVLLGVFGLLNIQAVSVWLGANSDTSSYVIEYLSVMFLFGWVIALEQVLSIFVRNDGSPKLSMMALATTSIVNIILNFYTIMILNLGVTGAAISTVLGGFAGLLVLSLHFFNRQAQLRKMAFQWSWKSLMHIFAIGFPSFLAEAGLLAFVTGYNLAMVSLAGTEGVAAFSVINYLHGFMFLSFFGIEMALQPLISYYHGAEESERIKSSMKIGEKTAVILGILLLVIGWGAAPFLVGLFGIESTEIKQLAIDGIRLFFIGYVFLGYNFVYMSYFQSIGRAGSSVVIIILRSFVFLFILLWILPKFIGVTGVWLSLPLSEFFVAVLLFFIARKHVMGKGNPAIGKG